MIESIFASEQLAEQASALGQVLMIDLVLAGDNAVAVGLAAAALPTEQRRRAILIGLAAVVVMRIGFALITVQLARSAAWHRPKLCRRQCVAPPSVAAASMVEAAPTAQ